MINPNKSLVIFSHPRSGSTWFQNSLKQYSLGELFNLNIKVVSYDKDIHFSFEKHGYDLNTAEIELEKRFGIFNHFESIKDSVSVKIHTTLLNPQMINFLKTKEIQHIVLDRLSKSDTFWSFLIGWNLNSWHNEILPQSITVTPYSFEKVIKVMSNIDESLKVVTDNFSPNTIHYEDLINMKNNDWFNSTSRYKLVNGKSVVNIVNLDEVNSWLINAGYKQWIMN
jgi:hypothetical protein